jgi:UDP-N-acetyl-D-mannosaminuronate dehydrogenase
MSGLVYVVGLGEVGRPLFDIVCDHYPAVGVDLDPVPPRGPCGLLHICLPFEDCGFVRQVADYVALYQPALTVVNSTVAPGTTRAIWEATGVPAVHSPVRGKHARMRQELLTYPKFIGGIDGQASHAAEQHFRSLGMQTRILSCPEATELAKLCETTYFGLLIAWAQEVERYCGGLGLDYDEVVSIFDGIGYLPPVKYTPGFIGGHCIMPNISLLKSVVASGLLDAIEASNRSKARQTALEPALARGEPARAVT